MKTIVSREPNQEDVKYLQSISREELMTVEDEFELVRQIRLGEGDIYAAKDKLMRANTNGLCVLLPSVTFQRNTLWKNSWPKVTSDWNTQSISLMKLEASNSSPTPYGGYAKASTRQSCLKQKQKMS